MQTNSIIIAALTFRRPDGLTALLDAIELQVLPTDRHVTVLIIDNSPEASAFDALTHRAKFYAHQLIAIYEPERGIAHARNRVLDFARRSDADCLLMVDDDEIPREDWAANMLDALNRFAADAAIGPVFPQFDIAPPHWICAGNYLSFGGYKNGELLTQGNTSNAAISINFLRQHPLEFDRIFDFSGGEDTFFFSQVRAKGGKIVFAKDAIVEERIVAHRATLGWLRQRWRRTGNTDARIRMLLAHRPFHPRYLLSGALRTMIGTIIAGLGAASYPFKRNHLLFKGVRILERGVGYFLAGSKITIDEYKNVER